MVLFFFVITSSAFTEWQLNSTHLKACKLKMCGIFVSFVVNLRSTIILSTLSSINFIAVVVYDF